MTAGGRDNLRTRVNGIVPPPGGATFASFTLFAALAALIAMLYASSEWLAAAGVFGFPADAAWVRATFARSIATGHGLTFNSSAPVAGVAAPSWLLALGLGAAVSGDFIVTAKALGVVSVALAAILTWALALRLLEDWRFAFLAGLLVVVSPVLSAQSLAGTEGPLAAMLVAAAVYWQGVGWSGDRWQRTTLVIAVGLGALARPELILLLPLILVDRLLIMAVRARFERCFPLALTRALAEVAGAVLIIIPYVLYNFHAGGPLWQRPELAMRPQPWLAWTKTALAAVWVNNPMLLIAAVVGLVVVVLAAARDESELPTLLPALTPLALLLLPGFLWQGISLASARHAAAYLMPIICLLGAAGLYLPYRVAKALTERMRNRAGRLLLRVGIICTIGPLFGLAWLPQERAWEEHGGFVKRVNNLQVCAGQWALQHLAPDASIASREVGGIGFFGHRRVVDLGGTISSEGISHLQRAGSLDSNLLSYLEKTQPSHLAIRPGDFPDLAQRADLLTPALTCVNADRATGGATTLVLYETPWPPPSIRGLTGQHH